VIGLKQVQSEHKAQSGSSPARESVPLQFFLQPEISANGYSAWVTISKVAESANVVYTDVLEFLKKNNITYGLKTEALQGVVTAIKNGPKDSKIIVAEGAALMEGVPGLADYKFRTKLMAGKVDKNKIDFRERGAINNVDAGQVLARIKPEVPGKPGMRVDGDVDLPAQIERIKIPEAGAHVAMTRDGEAYVYTAEIAGHARLVINEIQVNPDFRISGDLDYTKGNVDFVGNVEISGSVKSGFKINVGGDLVIGGDVEQDAEIHATGNVIVKKTIFCGKEKGKVFAGKSITADKCINSLVECKGDVFIKNEVSESRVFCAGKFATKWGTVAGSLIEAVGGIVVNNVGVKNGNSDNKVFAGAAITAAERLAVVNAEIDTLNHELALLAKQVQIESESKIGYTDKEYAKLEEKQQDEIKRQGAARSKHAKTIKDKLDVFQAEKRVLLPRIMENSQAVIQVNGSIYPTCLIRVREKTVKVLDREMTKCVIDGFDRDPVEKKPAMNMEEASARPDK
jgi:uncharacterized protein (DUF342 family)